MLRLLVILLFVCGHTSVCAQAMLDAEGGSLVHIRNNDNPVPAEQEPILSLKNNLNQHPAVYNRLQLHYTLKSRHTLSILFASLSDISINRLSKNVKFEGVVFPSTTKIRTNNKFNSYRITYRYDFIKNPDFIFGVGVTAKIKDVNRNLAAQSFPSSRRNTGFSPILNFRMSWQGTKRFGLLIDGYAHTFIPDGDEDVLIAVTYKLNNHLVLKTGYRILETGAKYGEVYNFGLFHYAGVGLSYTFNKR